LIFAKKKEEEENNYVIHLVKEWRAKLTRHRS
jgi:hypothetical protein